LSTNRRSRGAIGFPQTAHVTIFGFLKNIAASPHTTIALLCLNQPSPEGERFERFVGREQSRHPPLEVHPRANLRLVGVPVVRFVGGSVILGPDGGRNVIQNVLLFNGQAVGAKLAPSRQVLALEFGLILRRELGQPREPFAIVETHESVVGHVLNLCPDRFRNERGADKQERGKNGSHGSILLDVQAPDQCLTC